MKARTLVSICLLAGAAWAQSAPPSQKVVPDAAEKKPTAAKPAAAKPVPAKPVVAEPVAPKPAAAKPVAAKPKVAEPAAAKPVARTAAPAAPVRKAAVAAKPARKPRAKQAAAGVQQASLRTPDTRVGKRDPFTSPIRESGGPAGPTCTTGKKCLAIDTVDLKGIVRSAGGMIAVVESGSRKVTYFLRENDPVFNGYVVKITPDSIVFRENVMDRLGRQSTRDIVRRVVAPPV